LTFSKFFQSIRDFGVSFYHTSPAKCRF